MLKHLVKGTLYVGCFLLVGLELGGMNWSWDEAQAAPQDSLITYTGIEQHPESASGPSSNSSGKTPRTRFSPPKGYTLIKLKPGSFGAYLSALPLKPPGSPVLLYDGTQKSAHVHSAVVDLPIGSKNLHQCADDVIRLWADYNRQLKNYDQIHFNFTNGFKAEYTKWIQGERISVRDGRYVNWVTPAPRAVGDTEHSYWRFLEKVFSYAGTASLVKELQPVQVSDMKAGDIWIQGGSLGRVFQNTDLYRFR